MKSSSLLAPLAAASAAAAVLPRDITIVSGALNQVMTDLNAWDASIRAFDAANPQPQRAAFERVMASIRDGTARVQTSTPLSRTDAASLMRPVNNFRDSLKTFSGDLQAKRPDLERASMCETLRTELSSVSSGSQSLIQTVVGKVPPRYQGVSENMASRVSSGIAAAQANVAPDMCKDAGPSAPPPATPGGGAPTMPTPGAGTPMTPTPGSGTPDTQRPGAGTPMMPAPGAGTPDTQTPGGAPMMPAPGAETPETATPGTVAAVRPSVNNGTSACRSQAA